MSSPSLTLIASPAAAERLAAAREFAAGAAARGSLLIVGATRAAADEFAARVALERGALFGVGRAGFYELMTRLALPRLASEGLSPTSVLGEEALVSRAAFDAVKAGALRYFEPVAMLPGFPRAAARTLAELQLAGAEPAEVAPLAGVVAGVRDAQPLLAGMAESASADLAELLDRLTREAARAGTVGRAGILGAAAGALDQQPGAIDEADLLLLDVTVESAADANALVALVRAARSAFATVPQGDERTIAALHALTSAHPGASAKTARRPASTPWKSAPPRNREATALERLQRFLFSDEPPSPAEGDDSVVVLSAPGEGREAVEIARRVLLEARRGIPFDEMAVLLRAPQTYLPVLEHALERAGVPVWFHRGTRQPDPAGRALLALLRCAEENLSAKRFAEYVSLGQVPGAGSTGSVWAEPVDEATEGMVPADDRGEEAQPDEERQRARARGETRRDVAGTLRAPWRWEDLIVEAAVIGGLDRWQRRLGGLAREYARRLREAESDDPESSRSLALRRDAEQLGALCEFAEPVLAEMAAWPAAQTWGEWIDAIAALSLRVLSAPARVLRGLQELAPLATVGPVGLREVREVLTPRLSTLGREPPRRRHGRVFVGTPQAARGRSFRVAFVPGLAERVFPQRLREDPLLADEHRVALGRDLATRAHRAADERLQLHLAVGAASDRVYLSFPRVELEQSRPRVPSFYVLDAVRAVEGRLPSAPIVMERAFRAGGSALAWPSPRDAATSIDELEHDLSMLGALLTEKDRAKARGRGRYLYELSPSLQRSLTSRWLRYHRSSWDPADGLVRVTDTTRPALAAERLGARPYSLTALQRYALCPYQFLLAAVYRLAPLEQPAPLQQLDPLTRGELFHRMQAQALRSLQRTGLLPLTAARRTEAEVLVDRAVAEVEQAARDELAPAIDRVWRDEIASIARDLRIWVGTLVDEGAEWTPERFEFAFGLDDTSGRDERSTRDTARVKKKFRLRGSIDVIERHRETGFLRVTDNKTGRRFTESGKTIVQGGRVLQPVVYGLALESLWPKETVYSGRLFFCTSAGGFTMHEIPLLGDARRVGLEALEIIDRGIELGLLAARPADGACDRCDFLDVCGRNEEVRTRRKEASRFADLDALRKLP